MPLILAIEPDRRQAAQLSGVVRRRVDAELILVDTTERALDAIIAPAGIFPGQTHDQFLNLLGKLGTARPAA